MRAIVNFYCDKFYFRFKGKLIKINGEKSGKGDSFQSKMLLYGSQKCWELIFWLKCCLFTVRWHGFCSWS